MICARIGCDFSSVKVADTGVADRRVVDGHVFYKQDPRKKQRLAFGSLIDLNKRSRAAAIKIRRVGVAELPELFRLKCASHRYTADTNSTHFKWNNPLVYRVSA
jgi:hypothetical protein